MVRRSVTIPSALASANNAQNVAFLHDDEVFTVDLHFGARPFAEQDLVAGLDVERRELALFGLGARADGDDFALLRLFLRGVGDDDPARGLLLGLDTTDEDTIMKRPETHRSKPLFASGWLNLDVSTLPMRVPTLPCMWLSPVHLSTGRLKAFVAGRVRGASARADRGAL